nr:MAG TPA: hypothetical protein [Caudoviricetes sp.]
MIINTSFYNLSYLLFPHRIFAFAKVFGFVLDFTFSYILSASGSQQLRNFFYISGSNAKK